MFITLEGIEGSGKTTQMEAIAGFLAEKGHQVITTREPGATQTG
ncbi:MAG: dTMP kinase, partial [Desulfamplus sp.]|nr:dTMP kinase [Desulfamplus sp.]